MVSLSFYLALGKRRGELRRQGTETRAVLRSYNEEFLNKNMHVCLALAIVFYSLWARDVSETVEHIIWTVPLVICLCLKYSLDIEGDSDGDPMEVLLHDRVLLLLTAAFAALTLLLLYL